MSNGSMGCGSASAEFSDRFADRKGKIVVSQCWTSASSYVQLGCEPDEGETFSVYLDSAGAAAVEFAVAVLKAVDAEDLAGQLTQRTAQLTDQHERRERANAELSAAADAARAAFLAATTNERAAYDAAVTAAEKKYHEATGERVALVGSSVGIRAQRPNVDPFD